jgi:dienelactone hydrolase
VDNARPETLTDDPGDVREFDADFWYPAARTNGFPRAPYQTPTRRVDYIAAEGAEDLGAANPPAFFFDYLALMGTHSYVDAPPASAGSGFPVIAFTPGFLGSHDNGQAFFEELASHGYVVFSTSQPYEHASVVKPDGTVVPYRREHAEALKRHMKEVPPLLMKLNETEDPNEKSSIIREALEIDTFFDNNVRIRAADIRHVIDELERMNSGDRQGLFTGKLDMSRLGVFGHSLGGSTAGQVCVTDDRFDACVDLDGFPFGDLMKSSLDQPYMLMYSQAFSGWMDPVFASCRGPAFKVTVADTNHSDYTDEPYVMPIVKRMGMSGPIDGMRMIRITNDHLLSFFDRFLKGDEAAFPPESAGGYPEVTFVEMTRNVAHGQPEAVP